MSHDDKPKVDVHKGVEPSKTIEHGRIDPDNAADAAPGPFKDGEDLAARQDQLLDEALEETFPGSDPISPKQIT